MLYVYMKMLIPLLLLPLVRASSFETITISSISSDPQQAITTSLISETSAQGSSFPTSTSYSLHYTFAPNPLPSVFARQKCFNDQGFSVDCATWTGYYYTWGPSSNPYLGGPGEGGSGSSGSGSGSDSGSSVVVTSDGANQLFDVTFGYCSISCLLAVAFMLVAFLN